MPPFLPPVVFLHMRYDRYFLTMMIVPYIENIWWPPMKGCIPWIINTTYLYIYTLYYKYHVIYYMILYIYIYGRMSSQCCPNINTPSQRGRHSSSCQSLSLKYKNFTLDSWHLSVSLGRCLSPTWTEGKLLLRLSLWANWLSLRSGSLWVCMW